MDVFSGMRATVERALSAGRIGTPVAVRSLIASAAHCDTSAEVAAALIASACEWFQSSVSWIATMASSGRTDLSVLASFARGESLSVSVVARPSAQQPSAQQHSAPSSIVVFGNHGLIHWRDSQFHGAAANPATLLPSHAQPIAGAIEQSVAEGVSIHFAGDRQFAKPVGTLLGAPPWPVDSLPFQGPQPPYGVLLVAGEYTHQPGYAQAFASDSRCRLIGVTDESNLSHHRIELNRQTAERFRIPYLPDFHQAIRREDVQIVSVCAEPERRGPIVRQIAEAGKHLYLDKPLAGSMDAAREMVGAVRRSGVASHMFSQITWSPARDLGAFTHLYSGNISSVHSELCFAKGQAGKASLGHSRMESAVPTWFEGRESKRELTNIGVYPIVALLWSLRRGIRRVVATTGNYFFAEHQRHDMEDFGQILMELDGGIVATATTGRTGWCSHPASGINRISIVNDHDVRVFDAFEPRAEVWSDSDSWHAPRCDPNDPMAMWAPLPNSGVVTPPKLNWFPTSVPAWHSDVAHFVDRLQQGVASEVPIELAAAASSVLFASYQSAAEGRIVQISN